MRLYAVRSLTNSRSITFVGVELVFVLRILN